MIDIFDTGTPKYSTTQAIYDGLVELTQTEEMNILTQIGADVSWDNQTYYYTEKGDALKEKFEKLSEYGNKMWVIDLAVWRIDSEKEESLAEIHDIVFDALNDTDLAKRIDFKRLFIEKMLKGDKSFYNEIAEEFESEIRELNRFEYYGMVAAFNRVMQARNEPLYVSPYPNFCQALYKKVKNLNLAEEIQLVIECRALLNSYDDFIFGLRANQALYEAQEQQYRINLKQLQENYDKKVQQLLLIAKNQGLILDFCDEVKLLEIGGTNPD